MTELSEKPKPTLEDLLPRLKLLIVSVMMFPMIGMLGALALIIWRTPQRLDIIVPAIVFLILFYAGSIYYIIKRIDWIIGQSKSRKIHEG